MTVRNAIIEKIEALSRKSEKDIVALRRHFHAHPETSWNETETSLRIEEELRKLGCENIRRGFGGTDSGVVAEIAGGRPGRCVALRADIDALPLNEENDVEYRSRRDGAMHACGHDAHTAGLLGAARILTEIKGELKGRVRLLFQPAEEHGIKPGAKAMVDDGALSGVDAVFGLHVFTNLPSGTLMYRSGPIMAAADGWELTISGKGGHGSAPENAIDPTIAAFQIGNALQTVISREVSPKDTAVLSIGSVTTSSTVFNIIPERVEMKGTVRTFRPEVQDCVQSAIERVIAAVGQACRCGTELRYTRFIPATINDPETTEVLRAVAEELLGAEHVTEAPLMMGSEDFSYFGQVVPATFAHLGVGDPDREFTRMPHHSPKFDLDETQLRKAAALHAGFAWRWLDRN